MKQGLVLFGAAVCALWFLWGLSPRAGGEARAFEVRSGENVFEIARSLKAGGFVRSAPAFALYALLTGSMFELKAGAYDLSSGMSAPRILGILLEGRRGEAEVVIPEGSSVYLIDAILGEAGVLQKGELLAWHARHPEIEGRLFPDTYRFYLASSLADVLLKFGDTFSRRAAPLLADAPNPDRLLILASLLEKEVSEPADQRLVAGILLKRLTAGMPLQVDASICYIKQIRARAYVPCLPLAREEFRTDLPYNTYLYKGLPPGPIGSPGTATLEAVKAPAASKYWFYLSDPATGRTIFAETFEQHNENRAKYLGL